MSLSAPVSPEYLRVTPVTSRALAVTLASRIVTSGEPMIDQGAEWKVI
jgi:hypothetical protein